MARDSGSACTLRLSAVARVPLNLQAVVNSHGWRKLAPWVWEEGTLSRRERVGKASGVLSVRQVTGRKVEIVWRGDKGVNRGFLVHIVKRWLSWDWDHTEFCNIAEIIDPSLSKIVLSGGGRFLRGSTFYEDFVKTVCTINTTWAQTCQMAASLVELSGGVAPSPLDVLSFGHDTLKEQCRLGFRSATLIESTRRMLDDGVLSVDGDGDPAKITYDYLLSLRGIGPYAAAHCRMLLNDFSRLPIDSEVTSYLRKAGVADADFTTHFRLWENFAFLGYKLRRISERPNWIGE